MQLLSIEVFNAKYHYENNLVVCFDANAINTKTGEIKVNKTTEGQIQIGLESIDKIAIKYNFISIERMFYVKNQEWCDTNGAYPMNIFRIVLEDNRVIQEALEDIIKDKSVIFAEFDPKLFTYIPEKYIPNDPNINNSWHLHKIQAPELWKWYQGDSSVIVAIIDSGVKWNHADLGHADSGNGHGNIWIDWNWSHNTTINWNTGVVSPHSTSSNGIIGWSFAHGQNNNQSFQNWQSGNSNNAHGTMVAGCVGAIGDNGIGTAGVAMNVRMMVTRHQSTSSYSQYIENGYEGIYWAADRDADIINCSWGGEGGAGQANTCINYATNQGSLVVVAAGNDGVLSVFPGTGINWPANCINALTVGATTQNDRVSSFSEYGPGIDVMAPGQGIFTTYYNGNTDTYTTTQGTSFAAPIAAGVAAMIKGVHPEFGPLEIKEKIKLTCDPIDDMWSPEYYGYIGSGRINAFRAVMQDFIPNIFIENVVVTEHQGDSDGIPNLGETVAVRLQLFNEDYWVNATGISASISSDIPGVEILQPNLQYNNILHGQYVLSTNAAIVRLSSSMTSLTIPFTLSFSSNQEATSAFPYTVSIPFNVEVSASLPNWPLMLNGQAVSAPKIADLDGTGPRLITVYNGLLHVVNAQKIYNQGFPLALGDNTQSGIAIGHINGPANTQQIVVATSNGIIKVINHIGEVVVQRDLATSVRVAPVIADLNNNGHNDIIIATNNGRLHIMHGSTLNDWDNYPLVVTGQINTHLAVGDVTGDNIKNIVFNTSGPAAALNVINPMTRANINGFPISGSTFVGPTLARLTGNSGLQIIVSGTIASNCPITIYNSDGSILEQTTNPARINTEIAIVDLFNNGSPKLIFADNAGNIHVKNIDFTNVAGFPKNVGGSIESSPVFADLDNDNQREIIFGDLNGVLHILKTNGQYISGYPRKISEYPIRMAPAISRMNNSNGIVFLVNSEAVLAIDTKRYVQRKFWNSFRANIANTASYNDPFTPDTDIVDPIITNNLQQNYPNPFNPTTTINFTITNNENVKLSIFNIKGQLVKTLIDTKYKAGEHRVVWNGLDTNNYPVTSGLYFYKLETDSYSAIKKMVMLK